MQRILDDAQLEAAVLAGVERLTWAGRPITASGLARYGRVPGRRSRIAAVLKRLGVARILRKTPRMEAEAAVLAADKAAVAEAKARKLADLREMGMEVAPKPPAESRRDWHRRMVGEYRGAWGRLTTGGWA